MKKLFCRTKHVQYIFGVQKPHNYIYFQLRTLNVFQVVPPCGYIKNPMNAVTTKFVRTSTNKLRCPIFCVVVSICSFL